MNILYVGWIGHGNLGDDLLWDVFRSMADQYLNPDEFTITPSLPRLDLHQLEPYDLVLLGGGSMITPGYIQILNRALKQKKQVGIWGSGIDWQSKDQIDPLLRKRGLFQHDFSPSFVRRLVRIVQHSNYVGVRGPLTHEVLRQLGVNMQKVEQSGDPGLLVFPSQRQAEIADLNGWDSNTKIIGVNWGTTYNKLFGGSELAVEDQLASTLKRLIGQGFKIYLYHVWGEDQLPSQRLYEKIGDPRHVRLSKQLFHQSVLVQVLSRCHLTINFKLHANVLSAAAKVPFIALGYRFKVYDFAASIDSLQSVVATDSKTLEQDILQLTEDIAKNREEIVRKYNTYTQKSLEKLERPFRQLFGKGPNAK